MWNWPWLEALPCLSLPRQCRSDQQAPSPLLLSRFAAYAFFELEAVGSKRGEESRIQEEGRTAVDF